MKYQYKITHINRDEHWISISSNVGFGLIYQWDGCFGISVIYSRDMTEEPIINFLEQYF